MAGTMMSGTIFSFFKAGGFTALKYTQPVKPAMDGHIRAVSSSVFPLFCPKKPATVTRSPSFSFLACIPAAKVVDGAV